VGRISNPSRTENNASCSPINAKYSINANADSATASTDRGLFLPVKISLVLLAITFNTCVASAEDVGLRLRFGLNDKEPTTWDGTVTVAPGAWR
jgi:hypothetical protein